MVVGERALSRERLPQRAQGPFVKAMPWGNCTFDSKWGESVNGASANWDEEVGTGTGSGRAIDQVLSQRGSKQPIA